LECRFPSFDYNRRIVAPSLQEYRCRVSANKQRTIAIAQVSGCESTAAASDLNAEKSALTMGWRGCRGRGAGALQVAAGSERFVAAGFGGALETPDIILNPPDNGTIGVFLTIDFVGLLQVVGVAFEDHASLFCV
jgi:hypothetical protein